MSEPNMWERLDRWQKSRFGVILFYGYLFAILITGVLAGTSYINNGQTARDARNALCELQAIRTERIKEKEFLFSHKDDSLYQLAIAQAGGIEVVRQQLQFANEDLHALQSLDCK